MNIKAMIISEMKKRRDKAAAELEAAEAALAYFATGAKAATGKAVVRRSRKTKGKATPAQLAGLKAAREVRAANIAAKKANGKPEGAVLSEAAATG